MTLFEFLVPLIAFAVVGAGIWVLRREARGLEKHTGRFPAE